MSTTAQLNWSAFKEKLEQHSNQVLQFQYDIDKKIDASYHITEIKQAPITSVDCGGKMNAWTEVIIQLWEPSENSGDNAMKVNKALRIVNLVEKTMPINPIAIVKIEFGNTRFSTQQMYPATFLIEGENLIVQLTPDFTQCKAIDRGDNCGVIEGTVKCCAPNTGCC